MWIDEFYTLRMIHFPTWLMIETTQYDAHPPLYYLILQAFMRGVAALGVEPTVWLYRMPGLLIQLTTLVVSGWLFGRLEFNKNESLFLMALLAANPFFCNGAAEMRNYAFCVGFIEVSFILFLLIVKNRKTTSFRKQAPLWFAYAAVAALSMWTHLLCGLVVFLLGLLWVAVVCKDRFQQRAFFILGAAAQLLIFLLVLPWLITLGNQLEYLQSAIQSWMTRFTADYLGYCFYVTVIFAQKSWVILGNENMMGLMVTLSIIALLLPWWGALMVLQRNVHHWLNEKKQSLEPDFRSTIFFMSFFLWAGFILITWYMTVYGIAQVFHANRYQAMTIGPALLFFGIAVLELKRVARWLPMVAATLLMQGFMFAHFATWLNPNAGGLILDFAKAIDEKYPPKGATIVVYPSEVIDVLPNPKGIYTFETVEQFLARKEIPKNTHFFDFPIWGFGAEKHNYLRGYLRLMVEQNRASSKNDYPNSKMVYYTVPTWSEEDFENILTERSFQPYPIVPSTAIRTVLAPDLPMTTRWLGITYDFYMNASQWGGRGDLPVPITPPLGPGKYTLHMIAIRIKDGETKDLQIKFPWKTEIVTIPYSPVNPVVEFTVPQGQTLDQILLNFPTVTPREVLQKTSDPRHLSICYNGSWIEPVPD